MTAMWEQHQNNISTVSAGKPGGLSIMQIGILSVCKHVTRGFHGSIYHWQKWSNESDTAEPVKSRKVKYFGQTPLSHHWRLETRIRYLCQYECQDWKAKTHDRIVSCRIVRAV